MTTEEVLAKIRLIIDECDKELGTSLTNMISNFSVKQDLSSWEDSMKRQVTVYAKAMAEIKKLTI